MTQTFPETRSAIPSALGCAILLVEDDEYLARALARILVSEGYEVVHAIDGGAAVDELTKRSFDAVLSDLHLGSASGVDVLRWARAQDPDLPLVLMSGMPCLDTALEAVKLGVVEYLVKPMTREQIARVLGRARSGRRSSRRPARPRLSATLSLAEPSSIVRLSAEFASVDAAD